MSQYVTTPDGKRHKFPDEATPEQIKAALAGSSAPPMAMTPEFNPLVSAGRDLKSRALGVLPTLGGFAGGIAGGIAGATAGPVGAYAGGVVGAAAGGAAGEGLREAASGEKLSPEGIALEGAGQGGWQAAGGLIAGGVGKLAKPLMHRALGTGKAVLSKHPKAIETVLAKGFTADAKGAAASKAARGSSAKTLEDLLSKAEASGIKLSTADVTKYVRERLRDKAIPSSEKAQLFRQLLEFRGDQGRKIAPSLLKEIKQRSQTIAKGTYTGDPSPESGRVLFNKELARGAKEQLETIPGVASQEAETQSLIGAHRAVSDAAMRPPRPFEIQRPGTYPVVGMLGSPAVTSRIALKMADPKFQEILRQSPRAAAELIQQLLHTAEPDATGQ